MCLPGWRDDGNTHRTQRKIEEKKAAPKDGFFYSTKF